MEATAAIAELRQLIELDDPVDLHRCRRLALRAASGIPDPQQSARLIDELTAAIHAIELAEIGGHDRQAQVSQVHELLDEIEQLSKSH